MKLDSLTKQINSRPLDDFLGLSAEHMYVILYSSIEQMSDILTLRDTFDRELLSGVPVVKKMCLLIKLIGEAIEAKATKNGYLPKKIVNALYDFHPLDKFTVPTEEYAPQILALRHAAIDCGWIKKKLGRFSLTKRGKHIFDKGFVSSDYVTLLNYWMRNYNWAFTDGYPQSPIIQQSVIFSFYLLHRKAHSEIATSEIVKPFLRAFPMALEGMPTEPNPIEQDPRDKFGRIYRLRFMEHFADYFGLVNYLIDDSLPYFERDGNARIKTTELFRQLIAWHVSDKNGDNLIH